VSTDANSEESSSEESNSEESNSEESSGKEEIKRGPLAPSTFNPQAHAEAEKVAELLMNRRGEDRMERNK
jgi:hypothetical protein